MDIKINKRKLIGAVVLLTGVFFLFVLSRQDTDLTEVADTSENSRGQIKEYASADLGISFEYPEYMDGSLYPIEVLEYSDLVRLLPGESDALLIKVEIKSDTDVKSQYTNDKNDTDYSRVGELKPTLINGLAASEAEIDSRLHLKRIYLERGKDLVLIDVSKDSKQIENILSTFRLTDSSKSNCVVGGCNGELCLDENTSGGVASICLYKSEYACYKQATCELQSDGRCGWTQTRELVSCLEKGTSPIYPYDYVLSKNDIPEYFVLQKVDDETREAGFMTNPGFVNSPGTQDSIYLSVYQISGFEFGIYVAHYKNVEDLDSELVNLKEYREERIRYLRGDNVLIMIWTDGENIEDLDLIVNTFKDKPELGLAEI